MCWTSDGVRFSIYLSGSWALLSNKLLVYFDCIQGTCMSDNDDCQKLKIAFSLSYFCLFKEPVMYFSKVQQQPSNETKFPFQSVKDKMTSSCLLNKGISKYVVHYDIIKFEFILPIINACNCNSINSNNFSFLVAKKPSFQTDNLLSF